MSQAPERPTSERRHDLDALRAFAMLLGIGLHAGLSFTPFPWPVQDTRQSEVFGPFFVAVHGFRMPLFFLLSGFFTAMLWQKRGLRALIRHRFRRILLPLLLGLVTVIPLLNWSFGEALKGGGVEAGSEIWTAAAVGDVETLREHLGNPDLVDQQDPVVGVTPLGWAALGGQTTTIDALLEAGADVDARNRDGSTALHGAAFLGRVEVAASLISAGADREARTMAGDLPGDSARAPWSVTRDIAAALRIPVSRGDVEAGRLEVRRLLEEPADGVPGTPEAERGKGIGHLLFHFPIFHHLWFLWFLCWLVSGFVMVVVVGERMKVGGLPDWLVVSPLRYLWLIPLTMIPQWYMTSRAFSFGPITSTGLLPIPEVLFYYAIFFGYGALYFGSGDRRGVAGRWWWLGLPLALLVILPVGMGLAFEGGGKGVLGEFGQRVASVALQVCYAWMMSFGFMGLFRQVLNSENRVVRYVSDASYWLYVAHLPLIVLAQIRVRDWDLPPMVKFLIVCVCVSGLLLVVYQFAVRYTWLGTLLNGPRSKRVSGG